jgi:lipopolysaccharide export system protein LptA
MAASHRKLAAVALLAACAAAAAAQEREQLPIQLTASSLNFDSQKGVVEYGAITITQGGIRITADRAVTTGVDFEDSRWQFNGTVRITMPDASLASETADVKFAGGEIQSATVTGAPATFEQKRKDRARPRPRKPHRLRPEARHGRSSPAMPGSRMAKTELTGETLTYSTANQQVVSHQPVVITDPAGEAPQTKPKPQP